MTTGCRGVSWIRRVHVWLKLASGSQDCWKFSLILMQPRIPTQSLEAKEGIRFLTDLSVFNAWGTVAFRFSWESPESPRNEVVVQAQLTTWKCFYTKHCELECSSLSSLPRVPSTKFWRNASHDEMRNNENASCTWRTEEAIWRDLRWRVSPGSLIRLKWLVMVSKD